MLKQVPEQEATVMVRRVYSSAQQRAVYEVFKKTSATYTYVPGWWLMETFKTKSQALAMAANLKTEEGLDEREYY